MAMPEVQLATSTYTELFLFGFATKAEVEHHVRTQTTPDQRNALGEIRERWEACQPTVQGLVLSEAGLPDTQHAIPLEGRQLAQAQEWAAGPVMRGGFQTRISFESVEVDKLVAPQRAVNLGYVKRVSAQLPNPKDEGWTPGVLPFTESIDGSHPTFGGGAGSACDQFPQQRRTSLGQFP